MWNDIFKTYLESAYSEQQTDDLLMENNVDESESELPIDKQQVVIHLQLMGISKEDLLELLPLAEKIKRLEQQQKLNRAMIKKLKKQLDSQSAPDKNTP